MIIAIILGVLFVIYVMVKLWSIQKNLDIVQSVSVKNESLIKESFGKVRIQLDDNKFEVLRGVERIIKEQK